MSEQQMPSQQIMLKFGFEMRASNQCLVTSPSCASKQQSQGMSRSEGRQGLLPPYHSVCPGIVGSSAKYEVLLTDV